MLGRGSSSVLPRLQREAAKEKDPEKLKAIARQILREVRKHRAAPALRPWSSALLNLRKELNLSQGQLAAKLDCSAMTVSRWERGLLNPPSGCLLELGKLAGPSKGWVFWNMAGITIEDVRMMLRLESVP